MKETLQDWGKHTWKNATKNILLHLRHIISVSRTLVDSTVNSLTCNKPILKEITLSGLSQQVLAISTTPTPFHLAKSKGILPNMASDLEFQNQVAKRYFPSTSPHSNLDFNFQKDTSSFVTWICLRWFCNILYGFSHHGIHRSPTIWKTFFSKISQASQANPR